jgi:ABC-2 type transport system ATP-binding protein
MEDIEQLCERIIIIREGELVYDGGLKEVVERHANHRIITAHLRGGTDQPDQQPWMGPGEMLPGDGLSIRIRVERAHTAEASSALLTRFDVADLAIEEPEIGTVIEHIMRGRDRT